MPSPLVTKSVRRCDGRRAFTLAELLVVMGIIGVLAGLVFAAAWKAVIRARASTCLNNMRQIGMNWMIPEGEIARKSKEDLWKCPEGGTYAFSAYVQKHRVIINPADTVLLYESKGGCTGDESDVALRHQGAANFIFCDGHAEFLHHVPKFVPDQ